MSELEDKVLSALDVYEDGLGYRELATFVYGDEPSKSNYSSIQRVCKRLAADELVIMDRANGKMLVRGLPAQTKDWYAEWVEDYEVEYDPTRKVGFQFKWSSNWIECGENGKPRTITPDLVRPVGEQSTELITLELRDCASRYVMDVFYPYANSGRPVSTGQLLAWSYANPQPDMYRLVVRECVQQLRQKYFGVGMHLEGIAEFLSPSCVQIGENGEPSLKPLVRDVCKARGIYPWHPSIKPPAEFRAIIEGRASAKVQNYFAPSTIVGTGDLEGLEITKVNISDL